LSTSQQQWKNKSPQLLQVEGFATANHYCTNTNLT
jgi:hypothetical protein